MIKQEAQYFTMAKSGNIANKEIEFTENVFRAASSAASKVDFIKAKQTIAKNKLQALGFPDRHDEVWKYYDFTTVLGKSYEIKADPESADLNLDQEQINKYKKLIAQYALPEVVDNMLVTINGSYSKRLSNFNFDNEVVKVINFNNPAELNKHPALKWTAQEYFANDIEQEENFFKAVNTALMTNGFLVHIDGVVDKPIHILHISNQYTLTGHPHLASSEAFVSERPEFTQVVNEDPERANNEVSSQVRKSCFNQIRSLIYAGKNSETKLIVSYIGLDEAQYFTNAVIEVILDEGAKLKLDKIQNHSQSAVCFYDFHAELAKDARLDFNSCHFGAKSSRENIKVDINASGAEAKLNGLYVVGGERSSHHRVQVNHNQGHSSSRQLFKGLLYDSAKAEFNGLINVVKDAQQTDAEQMNKHLLLSPSAQAYSRPRLNIDADDVKCSHGSTVGQLEEDELFYLCSRGLSEEEAKTMLTYSFCEESIHNLSLESARDYVTKLAVKNLTESFRANIHNKAVTKQCAG
jgi:Fe-S cluster assembly protein SufD